jgi:hypothetical protein
MERHRKQLASTLVVASALIAAVATFLLPPWLQAQTQAQLKGIDSALLAKAKAGDAASKLSPAELSTAQERVAKWFIEHPAKP